METKLGIISSILILFHQYIQIYMLLMHLIFDG